MFIKQSDFFYNRDKCRYLRNYLLWMLAFNKSLKHSLKMLQLQLQLIDHMLSPILVASKNYA